MQLVSSEAKRMHKIEQFVRSFSSVGMFVLFAPNLMQGWESGRPEADIKGGVGGGSPLRIREAGGRHIIYLQATASAADPFNLDTR